MRKPTMTLEDIQRALEDQDCQLQAACRELAERDRAASIAVPETALDHFRNACAPLQPMRKPTAFTGIPC
jgi:hypothetical protein